MKKIREKINLFIAKSPRKAVLLSIMIFNVFFILIASGIICIMSNHISGMSECSFWVALYRTTTMILDAGCIESIISDVGKAGVVAAIVCVAVIIFGMIFFTGAVIGYVSNSISEFIDSKNNGKNKLQISNHVVIINWNPRAAEIINEFLYEKKEVKVVILVPDNKDEIDEEIRNRLDTTLVKVEREVKEIAKEMSFFEKKKYIRENILKERMTYIVREGDVAAATDLDDICISEAKTVIILDDGQGKSSENKSGNTQTIKTLMQVSEISRANSRQTILVEVADDWTEDLVYRIIEFKCEEEKEKIIPISCERLLGTTCAQVAVTPAINDLYDNIFSTRRTRSLSQDISKEFSKFNGNVWDQDKPMVHLKKHNCKRSIIILGHNSNMEYMMEGLKAYINDRKLEDGSDALLVVVVDDEESLKKYNYYRNYPDVEVINADVYDGKAISGRIDAFYENAPDEATILILSDDRADEEDSNVFTYLIYIQEEIKKLEKFEPDFNREKLDVVVEVLNPKNEDIVKSYGADRVIISNKYISRIISQVCAGGTFYELYTDILVHGVNGDNDREIIVKRAGDFFEGLPGRCRAGKLVQAIASCNDIEKKILAIGYIRDKKEYVFFSDNQGETEVELREDDELILFG